jgi:hypothetical protein
MRSEAYFQKPEITRAALARYAQFVGGKGEKAWSIAESKLDVYRRAIIAFAADADEPTKKSSHATVFGHLRRWYGVGRNGMLWDSATVLSVLTNECQPCSRSNGVTLRSLESTPNQQAVVECLDRMRDLKRLRTRTFPIMAVAKTLHFFNPRLFAIYDNDIVLKKVYRVFKSDWDSCYDKIGADVTDEGIEFYLAYLLWGGSMIRSAHPTLMEDFADWFIQSVSEERNAEDFRDELRSYYATAFEFIIIGAAYLEAAAVPCLCG